MALRRRRVRRATSQQPCRMTMKFMRCPITFTAIRKQIWGWRRARGPERAGRDPPGRGLALRCPQAGGGALRTGRGCSAGSRQPHTPFWERWGGWKVAALQGNRAWGRLSRTPTPTLQAPLQVRPAECTGPSTPEDLHSADAQRMPGGC